MQYNIIEIFDSLEGEGKRSGHPATFIRLAGCNLSCIWCDTKYAQIKENIVKMSLDKIIDRVNKTYNRVTLTGGEPLMQAGIEHLIKALIEANIEVNIETNGSIDISKFRVTNSKNSEKLFFTIDCKLPISGQSEDMNWHNYYKHSNKHDVIKFIVGAAPNGATDLKALKRAVEDINAVRAEKNTLSDMPQIFIGAVAGQIDNATIAEFILKEDVLKNARLQVQLHKVVGMR